MGSHLRTDILFLILILVVTGVASSADARVFRMTGKWLQQRGAIAQIPIFGGIDNADGAMVSAMGSSPAALTIPVGDTGWSATPPVRTSSAARCRC